MNHLHAKVKKVHEMDNDKNQAYCK
jgi:hypothetical protein